MVSSAVTTAATVEPTLLRNYPRVVGGLKSRADKEADKKRRYQALQRQATGGSQYVQEVSRNSTTEF
jgi:hypothetical protein